MVNIRNSNAGVSAVVGTIMVLAVTVGLAAIVWGLLHDGGGHAPETADQKSLVTYSETSEKLMLVHSGGKALTDHALVRIGLDDGTTLEQPLLNEDGSVLHIGDRICVSCLVSDGKTITSIQVVDRNSVISQLDDDFTPPATPGALRAFTTPLFPQIRTDSPVHGSARGGLSSKGYTCLWSTIDSRYTIADATDCDTTFRGTLPGASSTSLTVNDGRQTHQITVPVTFGLNVSTFMQTTGPYYSYVGDLRPIQANMREFQANEYTCRWMAPPELVVQDPTSCSTMVTPLVAGNHSLSYEIASYGRTGTKSVNVDARTPITVTFDALPAASPRNKDRVYTVHITKGFPEWGYTCAWTTNLPSAVIATPASCQSSKVRFPENGTHTITVTAGDTYDSGTETRTGTKNVPVGITPPVVTITTPAGTYRAKADILVRADATDADGDVMRVQMVARSVGSKAWPTQYGNDTTSPYSVQFIDLLAGPWDVEAVAFDDDGLRSTPMVRRYISASDPPVVNILNPIQGLQHPRRDVLTATARVTDPDDGVAYVDFLLDGGSPICHLPYEIDDTYSCDIGPFSNGEHWNADRNYVLTVRGVDASEQAVEKTRDFTAKIMAPDVTLNTPGEGMSIAALADIAASATATDDASIAFVEFTATSTSWPAPAPCRDSTAPYQCTIPDLRKGSWNIRARAVDDNSLEDTDDSFITVTSVVPTVTITDPTEGERHNWPYAVPTLTVSAQATDPDDGVQFVRFWKGTLQICEVPAYEAANGVYSCEYPTVDFVGPYEQDYTVTARAFDNSSQASSLAARSFVVYNQVPIFTIDPPPQVPIPCCIPNPLDFIPEDPELNITGLDVPGICDTLAKACNLNITIDVWQICMDVNVECDLDDYVPECFRYNTCDKYIPDCEDVIDPCNVPSCRDHPDVCKVPPVGGPSIRICRTQVSEGDGGGGFAIDYCPDPVQNPCQEPTKLDCSPCDKNPSSDSCEICDNQGGQVDCSPCDNKDYMECVCPKTPDGPNCRICDEDSGGPNYLTTNGCIPCPDGNCNPCESGDSSDPCNPCRIVQMGSAQSTDCPPTRCLLVRGVDGFGAASMMMYSTGGDDGDCGGGGDKCPPNVNSLNFPTMESRCDDDCNPAIPNDCVCEANCDHGGGSDCPSNGPTGGARFASFSGPGVNYGCYFDVQQPPDNPSGTCLVGISFCLPVDDPGNKARLFMIAIPLDDKDDSCLDKNLVACVTSSRLQDFNADVDGLQVQDLLLSAVNLLASDLGNQPGGFCGVTGVNAAGPCVNLSIIGYKQDPGSGRQVAYLLDMDNAVGCQTRVQSAQGLAAALPTMMGTNCGGNTGTHSQNGYDAALSNTALAGGGKGQSYGRQIGFGNADMGEGYKVPESSLLIVSNGKQQSSPSTQGTAYNGGSSKKDMAGADEAALSTGRFTQVRAIGMPSVDTPTERAFVRGVDNFAVAQPSILQLLDMFDITTAES
jgi:hypothetical protein